MKRLIVSLIFILSVNFCFAINESRKISLEEAIKTALETNPQLKMSQLSYEASKNDIKSAARFQNPSLSTFQNIGPTGKGNPQQVGIEYPVEILKRGKRKALALSNSNIARNNVKFQEYSLIFEVKKAYIDFLLKKSNLKILAQQKELNRELLKSAILDFEKGKISSSDMVQAKIAYNRAVMAENTAKSELMFSQNRFNTVMNTSNIDFDTKEDALSNDYAAFLTINPKHKSIPFEKIKNHALSNRFDLLSSIDEVKSAENNLKVIKSRLIPDIEFMGGYAYQPKGSSDTGSFQSGAYAGVNIPDIPIFYRYQPEIKNAQLEIERAKLKYQDLQIDITRNITDAWEKFVISRDNLNFYNDKLLINSDELLRASKESFDKKESDITTFLVSKRLYLELMLGYQEALAQYYISCAELLKEMNVTYLDFSENL